MSVAISTGGGTGASAIESAYVNRFTDGFSQAFQQFDTILAPYFQMERQSEEFAYYDRIGHAEDMQVDNVRYADNPRSEIPHDRRRSQLADYHLGKYIEPKDMYRILTDPTNEYQVALRASGNRQIDDIARDNIFGDVQTGKAGGTTVSFVTSTAADITVGELSKGHSNPVLGTETNMTLGGADTEGIDIGNAYRLSGTGSATGLTLDKLKAVRYTMMRLDAIAQNETINMFIGSQQFQDLLGIDEVINSDYSVRKSLAEGSVTTFMGFRFIHYERLTLGANGRECIVATPRSMKICVAKELEVNAWRDTGKRNIPYIYLKLSMDAVRMWGEITGRVNCAEA
jgi:hypothetical protein